MMPEEDSFIDKGGSFVDPIAERWEEKFIELIATDEGYIVISIILLIIDEKYFTHCIFKFYSFTNIRFHI